MSNKVSSKTIFLNPKGNSFDLDHLLRTVKDYIALYPDKKYEIIIGTDSRKVLNEATFVTSVVIRRVGNGGIFFYTKSREKNLSTMRERIWRETMLSITLAQEIRSKIKDILGEELFWDKKVEFSHIHLDVGKNGPTRDLIDGVTGIVKGFGFEPVIKPYAYGAFVVADLYT